MANNKEDNNVFEKRLHDTIINGFTTLGLAMGQDLGLFKVMGTFDQPATSAQIAKQAGCKERYIREWLRFMVVADIVELQDDQYYLPPHRRGPLTATGTPMQFAQYIASLPNSHVQLLECFKQEGPLGYAHSKQSLMIGQFESTRADYFRESIPKFVDQVPGLKDKLDNGIEVCDIGCGVGHYLLTMATMYPNSQFTGIDIDDSAIKDANASVSEKGLQNIEFIARDCTTLPVEYAERFDYVTFTEVVHDFAHPMDVLKGALGVLKPGCYLSIIDLNIDEDINKQKLTKANSIIHYACSLYYCLTCNLQFEGSVGSGACVGKQKIAEYVARAGFKDVKVIEMPDMTHDILITAQKK